MLSKERQISLGKDQYFMNSSLLHAIMSSLQLLYCYLLFSQAIFCHLPSPPPFPPLLLELKVPCKVQAGSLTWATSPPHPAPLYSSIIYSWGRNLMAASMTCHSLYCLCWPPFPSNSSSVTGMLGLGVGATLLCSALSWTVFFFCHFAFSLPPPRHENSTSPPPYLLRRPSTSPLLLSLLGVRCEP